jgi:hypothetical protein
VTVPEVTRLRSLFQEEYRSNRPAWDYDVYAALDKALFRLIGEEKPDTVATMVLDMGESFYQLLKAPK